MGLFAGSDEPALVLPDDGHMAANIEDIGFQPDDNGLQQDDDGF